MVVQQTKGMTEPVVLLNSISQDIEKFPPVCGGKEDILPRISSGGYMIHSAGMFYSQRTCHVQNSNMLNVIFQDLTPRVTPRVCFHYPGSHYFQYREI